MRFVVLGTSELAIRCAREIAGSGNELSALVTLRRDLLPNNAADLPAAAQQLGVPCHEIADINAAESIALLKSLAPDYIFCSWPKILAPDVLSAPKYFVIGTHPTELPYNRGRHPLHWLIVLGIERTALSFFRMDPGVDTGNILVSAPFEIGTRSIGEAVDAMNAAGAEGMRTLLAILAREPEFKGKEQDHRQANYWRARNAHDGIIDFRMCALQLERLARSFNPPYGCVKLLFEAQEIAVTAIEPLESSITDDDLARMEPGKILACTADSITVKTGDAVVLCRTKDAVPDKLRRAKYVFPPTHYLANRK